MKKIIDHIVQIAFLMFTIFGNPLYQCLGYVWCSELEFRTQIATNVHRIDMIAYLGFLMGIFVLRILIYSSLFSLKKNMKPFNDFKRFYFIFIERHKYQIFGMLTFFIWAGELEGNIVGFFVAPIGIILGLIIATITIVRIARIPKKWHGQKSVKSGLSNNS